MRCGVSMVGRFLIVISLLLVQMTVSSLWAVVDIESSTGAGASVVGVAGSTVVDLGLTLVNDSATPITVVTVVIGAGGDVGAGKDVLSFTNTAQIIGTFDTTTLTLVLTAMGSVSSTQWQTALRTVRFSTGSRLAGPRTISFALGTAKPYAGNGHFYEVVTPGTALHGDGRVYWGEALAAAAARPRLFGLTPYLATITSAGESVFVSQKINAATWIAGSDDATQLAANGVTWTAEGDFYWAAGPEKGRLISNRNRGVGSPPGPVTAANGFANWNSGEPNNANNIENFIQLLPNAKWNDLPITSNSGGGVYTVTKYLVEYGGLPGDPAVNLQTSRSIEVTFDAPRFTSAVPVTKTVQNQLRPVFTGVTAHAEGIVQVQVRLDLTNNGSFDATYVVPTNASGIWTVDTSTLATSGTMVNLSDGATTRVEVVTFNTNVVDASAGSAYPSAPTVTRFTTDRTAPALPSLIVPSVTNSLTPPISGSAEPGSTVTITVDPDGVGGAPAVVITTVADPVTGFYSITSPTLMSGQTATVSATATDIAGNISPPTPTKTITVDTLAPPKPVITGPSGFQHDPTPVLVGTAEPGSVVTVTLNGPSGLITYRTTASNSGSWSIDTGAVAPISGTFPSGGLADGSVSTLGATATDAANNVSPAADPVTFTTDLTPPPAPVISGPRSPTNDGTPTIIGTGEAGDVVTVRIDTDGNPATTADVVTYAVNVDSSGHWAVDTGVLVPISGTFPTLGIVSETAILVDANQRDAAGNTSASTTATVLVDTIPPDAPILTGPSSPTNDTTPDITGFAEPGSTVTILLDRDEDPSTTADQVTLVAIADPVTGAWSITSPPLTDGAPVVLAANATDAAGNTGPSARETIIIDTQAPTPPLFMGPVPWTTTATPVLSGVADPDVAAAGGSLTVTVDPNGDGDLSDAVVYAQVSVNATTGAWQVNLATATPNSGIFTPFVDGQQPKIFLTSVDGAGNASTGFGRFTVDLIKPTDPVISGPGGVIADHSPVITGTAEANAIVTVTMQISGGLSYTFYATTDANGHWAVDTQTQALIGGGLMPAFADGAQVQVLATARDAAGNQSTGAGHGSFVVVGSRPTATLATVTLGERDFAFDGQPKPVAVTVAPAGLALRVLWHDERTPNAVEVLIDPNDPADAAKWPSAAGRYVVRALVVEAGWSGETTGILTIFASRDFDLDSHRCGMGSSVSLIGLLMLVLFARLGWLSRVRSATMVALMTGTLAMQAEETVSGDLTPTLIKYGAKGDLRLVRPATDSTTAAGPLWSGDALWFVGVMSTPRPDLQGDGEQLSNSALLSSDWSATPRVRLGVERSVSWWRGVDHGPVVRCEIDGLGLRGEERRRNADNGYAYEFDHHLVAIPFAVGLGWEWRPLTQLRFTAGGHGAAGPVYARVTGSATISGTTYGSSADTYGVYLGYGADATAWWMWDNDRQGLGLMASYDRSRVSVSYRLEESVDMTARSDTYDRRVDVDGWGFGVVYGYRW